MKMEELKDKLLTSVDLWADTRFDDMVKSNPMLAIPSVYMKRAAHNIIAKNRDNWSKQLDNATMFLADENGVIDTDTIFEDLMQMLKTIEDYHFDFGIIHGHIGSGTISFDLPDNIATAILFGSKRSLSFTADDFTELKNLIVE